MNFKQNILSGAAKLVGSEAAQAHCDFPCGIYDPHQAQIGALTTLRMIDLIKEHAEHLSEKDFGGHSEVELRNNFVRAVNIKEEHAELTKREIRVIWGDYFKQEHFDKYPELPGLVHKIMQLGSKSRQTVDRSTGEQLLDAVNHFAEIFWETKGQTTKRVKAPYKPEAEIVVPDLK